MIYAPASQEFYYADQDQVEMIKFYLKTATKKQVCRKMKYITSKCVGAYELKHIVEVFFREIGHPWGFHHESAAKACRDMGYKTRKSYLNAENRWNYEVAMIIKRDDRGFPISLVNI
tara:strand:- start:415 stop:765 length:351 start_codon:yes stop_codon:yes gene_type:complete